MSENKKYYYIKLKDGYFEKDNIKILEAMENGYIYSLIILKMCLKASKYNGRLMMTPTIPYDPKKIDIFAKVINHDVAHVKEAIRMGIELDLIALIDGHEIWMTEIQNMIGQSSTEADRIRDYRTKLNTGVQMYDKCTPKREREIEIEIDKELDKKIKKDIKTKKDYSEEFETFWKEYPKHEGKKAASKAFNTLIKNKITLQTILDRLIIYKKRIDNLNTEYAFIRHPSTFLNNLEDYADGYVPPKKSEPREIGSYTRPRCSCGGEFNPGGFCMVCGREIS